VGSSLITFITQSIAGVDPIDLITVAKFTGELDSKTLDKIYGFGVYFAGDTR
jgi:hypothetical protein